MAYKPSTGDIAARVGKAAEAWSPMIEHGIKADILARSQAAKTAQWAKEKQLDAMKYGVEISAAQLKEFNDGMGEGTFSIAEEGEMRNAYFEAFNRTYDNLEEYYRLSGVPITQKKVTNLTPLISNLFESWKKQNPNGDSAVLKWGIEDGVWGDVMKRIHPSIHRDDAQRVWESLWNDKFADWKGRDVGEGKIDPRSFAGGLAEVGIIVDYPWEAFQKVGEFASHVYTGKADYSPWGEDDREVRSGLRDLLGVRSYEQDRARQDAEVLSELRGETYRGKPTITPTGEYQPMGMFGGGNGLIDGWLPNMPDAPLDEPLAADVANLEKSVDTLEDIEERAQKREKGEGKREFDVSRDISQEAATFLTQLLEAMAAYGNEEAEAMLSRQFLNLSSGAKKEIQNYLMSM